ncbi:hypothetical protein I4U23_022374 [Adineta vaga]|nr:hypothetical protein I4U23_022374 [Adineta vaga]
MNRRLFSRYPTFIYTSRLNATTATNSSETNPSRYTARPSQRFWRPAALVISLVGLVALL